MDFFWTNIFEYLKERRFAVVFFSTMLGLVGAIAAGGILFQIADGMTLLQYWPVALAAAALGLLALFWRSLVRARQARKNRYQPGPLSRDELRKARSKLLKR